MNFTFTTCATLGDRDCDDIVVNYDYSPPEYGFPGMVEVCSVKHEGRELVEELSQHDLATIEEACYSDYAEQCAVAAEYYDDEDAPRYMAHRRSFTQIMQSRADYSRRKHG